MNPPILRRSARYAAIPWNFSPRCGVLLKIARWTERSICGGAPEPGVRARNPRTSDWPVLRLVTDSSTVTLCALVFQSVRAWRGLRYNERYASQLEKKRERERQREQETAEAERKKVAAKANPFSVGMSVERRLLFVFPGRRVYINRFRLFFR